MAFTGDTRQTGATANSVGRQIKPHPQIRIFPLVNNLTSVYDVSHGFADGISPTPSIYDQFRAKEGAFTCCGSTQYGTRFVSVFSYRYLFKGRDAQQPIDTTLLSFPADDLGRTVKRLRLDSRSTSTSSRSRSKSPGPPPIAGAPGLVVDEEASSPQICRACGFSLRNFPNPFRVDVRL